MNSGLLITIRSLTLLGWLLLALADSLTQSKSSLQFYYNHYGYYLYAAANQDIAAAHIELFEQDQQISHLERAAKLGDKNGITALYSWLRQHDPKRAEVWRNSAVKANVSLAALDELSKLVEGKKWQQAQAYIVVHKKVFTELEPEHTKTYKFLEKTVLFQPQMRLASNPKSSPELVLGRKTLSSTTLPNACDINITFLVQTPDMLAIARDHISKFQTGALAVLPVCWKTPEVSSALSKVCDWDNELINCEMASLSRSYLNTVKSDNEPYGEYLGSHLVIMTKDGEANTRGGLMAISQSDSYSVFLHEFAHWLNYYDEYQIGRAQQQVLCKTSGFKPLGNNLIIAAKRFSRMTLQQEFDQFLYPTKTCDGTPAQAYKIFQEPTFMEYLDIEISLRYINHIIEHYDKTKIVPVAMNFALTFQYYDTDTLNAIDREHWRNQYQQWLDIAAQQGFPPAMRLLAQLRREQGIDVQAKQWLYRAANLGDPTAQVLLGHSFLEGQWFERDLEQSAAWYRRAALSSDPYGLYFYGKCFEMGWGCPKSPEIAQNWFIKAANAGSELANKKLNLSPPD